MPYSITVDAGHGGTDPGAVYNGRQEKDDNLRLALAVGEILQDNGIDVLYTRTTDTFIPLAERANIANNAGSDFFVSMHRNSFPTDNEVSGVETLVYDKSGIKYQMAQNVDRELANIGFKNLGEVARPNLAVLRRTEMPAILVEAGFINSDIDNELFDDNFNAIAQAIATGIMETIGVETGGGNQMFSVQVGAFRNPAYARRLQNELTSQGFQAYIDDSSQFDRVNVGPFRTQQEAVNMEQQLKRAGYPTLVVG